MHVCIRHDASRGNVCSGGGIVTNWRSPSFNSVLFSFPRAPHAPRFQTGSQFFLEARSLCRREARLCVVSLLSPQSLIPFFLLSSYCTGSVTASS